jgi:hypothetical protein
MTKSVIFVVRLLLLILSYAIFLVGFFPTNSGKFSCNNYLFTGGTLLLFLPVLNRMDALTPSYLEHSLFTGFFIYSEILLNLTAGMSNMNANFFLFQIHEQFK